MIYPSIRGITIGYTTKTLKLRVYLDRKPIDEDYEIFGDITAEMISDFTVNDFETVVEECIYSTEPISNLDSLDVWVYMRMENSIYPKLLE